MGKSKIPKNPKQSGIRRYKSYVIGIPDAIWELSLRVFIVALIAVFIAYVVYLLLYILLLNQGLAALCTIVLFLFMFIFPPKQRRDGNMESVIPAQSVQNGDIFGSADGSRLQRLFSQIPSVDEIQESLVRLRSQIAVFLLGFGGFVAFIAIFWSVAPPPYDLAYISALSLVFLGFGYFAMRILHTSYYLLFDQFDRRLEHEVASFSQSVFHLQFVSFRKGSGLVFVVLLSILFVFVAVALVTPGQRRVIIPPESSRKDGYLLVAIQTVESDPPRLSAELSFEFLSEQRGKDLVKTPVLKIEDEEFAFHLGYLGRVIADAPLELSAFRGDPYYFPWTKFEFAIDKSHLAQIGPVKSLPIVVVSQNGLFAIGDPLDGEEFAFFSVYYAPYYKVLLIIVFVAFLAFVWVLWLSDSRESLIELTVGVFAALFAMRSFMIPDELRSPTLVDQIAAVFILSLSFVFVIKYANLNRSGDPN